jgi:glycosyltransferase involved in cell wall biosynthesis
VTPGDAPALAAAIRRVLEDRGLRDRLAAGAVARADALFSRERMIARFVSVIDTVVRAPEELAAELARVTVR